jgi:hypothetical protein
MKYMKNKQLTALALLLASVLFFAQSMPAQKLVSGGKPNLTQVDLYRDAYCANLSSNYRVCKGRNTEDENLTHFIIQKNKKTLGKIDAPYFAGSGTEDFWAFRGDLDKDGFSEIVIASQVTISNGLGIAHFDIHIFQDPLKFGFQKPFTFPVEDFGEKGNFIYDPKRRETQILVSYWQYRNDIDPKRGSGMYLIGSRFRYRNRRLAPVFDKPMRARRLLYSFADERGDCSFTKSCSPVTWLKSKSAHKFMQDPPPVDQRISTRIGTVEKYEQISAEDDPIAGRKLSVRLNSGELIECVFWTPDVQYKIEYEKTSADKLIVSDYGFAYHRFLVPFDFELSAVFKKVEGKKVELETFLDEYNRKHTKIWFFGK